jgi:sugar phosphate permease
MLAWVVWSLAALFVVLNYVQQVFPSLVAQELSEAFRVNESALGDIAAIYFYAYAIMQIPVGMILDRFRVRWPLAAAILIAGAGAVGFSLAFDVRQAIAGRLIMGASSAFSFLGCLKLVQEWFPVSRFSTLAGMTNTAAMLGAACGAPLAILVGSFGWRPTMLWIGVGELILGVLVLLIVRDAPPGVRLASEPAKTDFAALMNVLCNPQVWINALYATSISLIFVAFGGLWGASFITSSYGLTSVKAADIASVLFLGGIVGSLFFGWFSDYLNSRKKPMIFAGLLGFLTICALLYVPHLPLRAFEAGLFFVGFFSSANIVSYAVARDLYPASSGLSIGLLSTVFYAGSATSQPLVGSLLEYHARRHGGGGLASLTPQDYAFGLTALVFFMAVAVVCSLLIRETAGGRRGDEQLTES